MAGNKENQRGVRTSPYVNGNKVGRLVTEGQDVVGSQGCGVERHKGLYAQVEDKARFVNCP